jgi:hypothetical protein
MCYACKKENTNLGNRKGKIPSENEKPEPSLKVLTNQDGIP